MEKYFQKLLIAMTYILLFLFPLFFLPITQEFFITNKFYLLGFGVLLLILVSGLQLLVSRKISWQKHPFDSLVLLFITTVALSTLFSSPNKIQALLNPSFGLVSLVSLTTLYFYLSRVGTIHELSLRVLSVSSILLSILTIAFFFQPFKNTNLPTSLQFLKNSSFTPLGNQLDLAIFLGFFVVLGIANVMVRPAHHDTKTVILNFSFLTFNLLALFLTVYSLLKPSTGLINQAPTLILPPFRLSWYAAVETLKRPLTALFGVGVDNFSSMFTAVKDFTYNQSPLWQVNSFSISRSTLLHIMTETGIFGLFAFALLIFNVIKQLLRVGHTQLMGVGHAQLMGVGHAQLMGVGHARPLLQIICLFLYLIICLLIFPSSLIVWFLFFVILSVIASEAKQSLPAGRQGQKEIATSGLNVGTRDDSSFDLTDFPPLYLGIAVIIFGAIGVSGYFLGRAYASEYYFKKSLDGVVANNVKQVYDSQRQAIIFNPYIERFRGNFAQTNFLIANNLAQKDPKNISEQDRQTITQAIQAAIAEGKAVVSLNPQKADGWQNLASIYMNVINAAEGADVWTISAYQRAILSDPQNPIYRVGLGGVYYSLKKYDDALKFFETAVSLKPDWPNASYNYAWANFQIKNYPQAVNAMQNTLSLLNPKLNKVDYEKVQKELEEFKKLLPKEEKEATQEGEIKPGTLNLPTPPETKVEPKIELPKEASPEAK